MVGGKQLKYLSKSGSKLSRETGLLWGSEAFNSSPEVHIYLELGHQFNACALDLVDPSLFFQILNFRQIY